VLKLRKVYLVIESVSHTEKEKSKARGRGILKKKSSIPSIRSYREADAIPPHLEGSRSPPEKQEEGEGRKKDSKNPKANVKGESAHPQKDRHDQALKKRKRMNRKRTGPKDGKEEGSINLLETERRGIDARLRGRAKMKLMERIQKWTISLGAATS